MSEQRKSNGIAVHIFSASAAMVGVCLTVINIFRLSNKLHNVSSLGDEILAVDAGAFLISCTLSYLALRTRAQYRQETIERIADWIFLAALGLMAVVCALIAYELI